MTTSQTIACKNCNCLINKLGQYPQARALVSYMTVPQKVELIKELLTSDDLLPKEAQVKVIQGIHEHQELAFEWGDIPHG